MEFSDCLQVEIRAAVREAYEKRCALMRGSSIYRLEFLQYSKNKHKNNYSQLRIYEFLTEPLRVRGLQGGE